MESWSWLRCKDWLVRRTKCYGFARGIPCACNVECDALVPELCRVCERSAAYDLDILRQSRARCPSAVRGRSHRAPTHLLDCASSPFRPLPPSPPRKSPARVRPSSASSKAPAPIDDAVVASNVDLPVEGAPVPVPPLLRRSATQDSMKCHICLDVFIDPVTPPCGHSLCPGWNSVPAYRNPQSTSLAPQGASRFPWQCRMATPCSEIRWSVTTGWPSRSAVTRMVFPLRWSCIQESRSHRRYMAYLVVHKTARATVAHHHQHQLALPHVALRCRAA